MPAVKIWVKKQLRLEPLTVRQREMVRVGAAGLLSVFKRLSQARGPEDGPAKPLTKRYAIRKSRMGRGNRRDLNLTGDMLRNLKLRTVTDNEAKAALTSRKERVKGTVNTRREVWLVFSPTDRQVVINTLQAVLNEKMKQMVATKAGL